MDMVLCFVAVIAEDLTPHFEHPAGAKIFWSMFPFQSLYHPVPWLKHLIQFVQQCICCLKFYYFSFVLSSVN
jgi:hypothetical protein